MNVETFAEMMLANGCTERQLAAVENVLGLLDKELAGLHLQIHAMRSIAHCAGNESFAKFADAILHSSQCLLEALREQHSQVAGLVGIPANRSQKQQH